MYLTMEVADNVGIVRLGESPILCARVMPNDDDDDVEVPSGWPYRIMVESRSKQLSIQSGKTEQDGSLAAEMPSFLEVGRAKITVVVTKPSGEEMSLSEAVMVEGHETKNISTPQEEMTTSEEDPARKTTIMSKYDVSTLLDIMSDKAEFIPTAGSADDKVKTQKLRVSTAPIPIGAGTWNDLVAPKKPQATAQSVKEVRDAALSVAPTMAVEVVAPVVSASAKSVPPPPSPPPPNYRKEGEINEGEGINGWLMLACLALVIAALVTFLLRLDNAPTPVTSDAVTTAPAVSPKPKACDPASATLVGGKVRFVCR